MGPILNQDSLSVVKIMNNRYQVSVISSRYVNSKEPITSERPTSTSSPECHRSPIDFSSPLRNVPPSPQLTTWNLLFCKGALCSLPRTSTSLTALNDTSLISFVLARNPTVLEKEAKSFWRKNEPMNSLKNLTRYIWSKTYLS